MMTRSEMEQARTCYKLGYMGSTKAGQALTAYRTEMEEKLERVLTYCHGSRCDGCVVHDLCDMIYRNIASWKRDKKHIIDTIMED